MNLKKMSEINPVRSKFCVFRLTPVCLIQGITVVTNSDIFVVVIICFEA